MEWDRTLYFHHYACFVCQKAFRKAPSILLGKAAICPNCGRPMHNMGRYFNAPKQMDDREWRKIQMLVRNDMYLKAHHGRRSRFVPTRLQEIPAFIETNKRKSQGLRLLEKFVQRNAK